MKPYKFSEKDIEIIGKVLECQPVKRVDHYRFVLENQKEKRRLSLEIYPEVSVGEEQVSLISIYTMNTHIQLHHCTGYVPSESLGEVVFISEFQGRVSGVIVEKEAGCSVYANVDRQVLSGDFTKMAPEIMLSGIALSVAEHLIPAENDKD